jgi:dihydrofolate reductase
MNKVIFQMMVSLDGFYSTLDKKTDWHSVDDEFTAYSIDLLHGVDTLIFGRLTYQLMAGYWPTAEAMLSNPLVAGKMNSLSKIVFSKTLSQVAWTNSRLAQQDVTKEIEAWKQRSVSENTLRKKDAAIFGSSDLALSFIQHGLVDEYRIIVNPVVLGQGKRLFEGMDKRLNLKLTRTRTFDSGNVLFYYEPGKQTNK